VYDTRRWSAPDTDPSSDIGGVPLKIPRPWLGMTNPSSAALDGYPLPVEATNLRYEPSHEAFLKYPTQAFGLSGAPVALELVVTPAALYLTCRWQPVRFPCSLLSLA
jgi:hypothetical protein